MSEQKPLLLSVKQVAELLALSSRTVWRLVSAGELPEPVRIGRAARWRMEDIEEFVVDLDAVTWSRGSTGNRK